MVERSRFIHPIYATKGINCSRPIRFVGPPIYGDYLVSGLAVATGANAPDLVTVRDGLQLYGFAGTGAVTEQAYFTIHILHDIKAGSSPTFHVHWTHNNATPSGDVKWQIEYSAARGYSADTYPATTTLSATQTAGAQYTHHITDDDDMTISESNLEPDMVLLGRLFRNPADAADTFEDDAMLIQVDMHYEIGQTGTFERNRPFGEGFS
jgi:hypothetical protein